MRITLLIGFWSLAGCTGEARLHRDDESSRDGGAPAEITTARAICEVMAEAACERTERCDSRRIDMDECIAARMQACCEDDERCDWRTKSTLTEARECQRAARNFSCPHEDEHDGLPSTAACDLSLGRPPMVELLGSCDPALQKCETPGARCVVPAMAETGRCLIACPGPAAATCGAEAACLLDAPGETYSCYESCDDRGRCADPWSSCEWRSEGWFCMPRG